MESLFERFQRWQGRRIHKWHHYFPIYERYLARHRGRPVVLIEIGLGQGGSLAFWRSYLGPQARIIGVDIDPACERFRDDGFEIHIGSQSDPEFLLSLMESVPTADIVIDDGGHKASEQITSFETIYPRIAETGVYLVEDTQTSYWDAWKDRTDGMTFLTPEEKRTLNQIIGNAYCHIFAFVEEFIVPQTLQEAQRDVYGEEARLRALIRFAEDETKHQQMFRRSMALFEKGFGIACGVIPGREEVAKVVLGKSRLCSLLLTSMIEWFTQLHYVEHVRSDEQLDGLFRDLIKYHWIDEATHAKLDSLLINEICGPLSLAQREHAVEELLELGGAVDGLLSQQADLDIESLQQATRRTLTEPDRAEIRTNIRRAYRWTFLVSGLRHPTFVKIVGELTEQGQRRLEAAAEALSA